MLYCKPLRPWITSLYLDLTLSQTGSTTVRQIPLWSAMHDICLTNSLCWTKIIDPPANAFTKFWSFFGSVLYNSNHVMAASLGNTFFSIYDYCTAKSVMQYDYIKIIAIAVDFCVIVVRHPKYIWSGLNQDTQ